MSFSGYKSSFNSTSSNDILSKAMMPELAITLDGKKK